MRQMRGDRAETVVIDGVLPTEREWAQILERKYVVNILSMPGQADSLASLAPFANRLTKLTVNSYSCSDLTLVDEMPNLEWFSFGGRVTKRPRLTGLKFLNSFGGRLQHFEDVLLLPSLRWAKVELANHTEVVVGDGLRDLTISHARGVESISSLRHSSLTRLCVEGARGLDISCLFDLPSLEVLDLQRIRSVSGVEAVNLCDSLSHVFFEDCIEIANIGALVNARPRFTVVGKNAFPPEFRALVSAEQWSFPRVLPRANRA